MSQSELADGTYDVLRNRLRDAAADLRARLKQLDDDRADVFGNIATELLATARITTEHNCVPRDVVAVGDQLLLGYNVQFGLKSEIQLADVFAAYTLRGIEIQQAKLDIIGDERFHNDFAELYRFYKDTRFARFYVDGPHLHLVFRVGKRPEDIKSFKWIVRQDGLEYVGNRADHEVRDPPQHAFDWKRTTRDQHHYGAHPHISIEDRVFVETVGGDLTIKIENNTQSGEGIYAESVEHKDQTLDDADIHYAILGNLVLLKVKPYQEDAFRYLLFNGKTNSAIRLDAIEHSCVLLPGDHGIIFPGGYYLQTGQFKQFDHGQSGMRYQRTIASPNGEDFLYLFYDPQSGTYIQLRYNLIRQTVDTPLLVHGQTLFSGGEMVCFRSEESPQRHHALQIWQTPFTGPEFVAENQTDSLLFKIGNKDLVRGMAECGEVLGLVEKEDSYEGLYVDLVKKSADILDAYFWIDQDATKQLALPLTQIRDAASAAVEEFEKVVRTRRRDQQRSDQVRNEIEELIARIGRDRFETIDDFVSVISELRTQRGHALGLKELRFVDEQAVESLQQLAAEWSERISRRCVDHLLAPGSLRPYAQRVETAEAEIDGVANVVAAKELKETVDATGQQLELLTETVSNLHIDDATKRTTIVNSLSEVLASINRVRSRLKARVSDLIGAEGRAEFASQMKLLSQTVAGYLDVCDTAEACDTYLSKLMVQIEELDGRFAEFDQFLVELASKRDEIYDAFESRKVMLVQQRNRHAESLAAAATRILSGIGSRAQTLQHSDEIAAYFAGDLMVEKVRSIVHQLGELGDSVRAEDLRGRLKTIREESLRSLKDRQDLFEDGGDVIRLGHRKFAVNRQNLDLTTVVRNGHLCLHLTGTQYFQPLEAPELIAAKDLWDQVCVSENAQVYRGEYLAVDWYFQNRSQGATELPSTDEIIQGRLADGYTKGVHDVDGLKILAELTSLERTLGRLRHRPSVRAIALWWLAGGLDPDRKRSLSKWIGGFAKIVRRFPNARPAVEFRMSIATEFLQSESLWRPLIGDEVTPVEVADYLFDEWVHPDPRPVVSHQAVELFRRFKKHAEDSVITIDDPAMGFVLARNWADELIRSQHGNAAETNGEASATWDPDENYRDELAGLILSADVESRTVETAPVSSSLEGLVGDHVRIQNGRMPIHYHELLHRVGRYRDNVVPRYRALESTKNQLLKRNRQEMRLADFKPQVLTSFVRNQLIDEVYLPMIGDNLAKQMGTAGDSKRTDRMGLLLLMSPPGYGKTTLMEYVANRLGVVFMKINGPAIGHGVTSLDPDEAPNAAAREEVQRLNLALEMGDNVMLYLDDIQHTHPELLQKFISLCDATRTIEGVKDGKTRTYDLRGRRVAVVMAGNPYTESGDRFVVPDMLSNRADVYNLGEIIGDAAEAFEGSYLENCLTSNASLARLATAPPEDAREIIRAAGRDSTEGLSLQSAFSDGDVREMVVVMKKLISVRDAVLRVNRAYIRSAAQADAYRTEPPFKLQGSYRNMNRIAERVAAVMNDAELQGLIVSAYEQEAQTLTTDNEANVLKFKELMGLLTATEKERWDAIKYAYVESVRMAGIGDQDAAGQLMRQLSAVRDGLESIRQVISRAIADRDQPADQAMDARFESIRQSMLTAGDQLSRTLADTSLQLESISRQQASEPPEQKILVQHKVPRVLVDLVRGQFHLMQEWLRPILDESVDNGRDLERLRNELKSLMATYEKVQKLSGDPSADADAVGDAFVDVANDV